MNSFNPSTESPSGVGDSQPDKVSTPQYIQGSAIVRQGTRSCELATTNLSVSLALAATLCIDAGSNAVDAAIPLLVGSTVAAEMAQTYADLLTYEDCQKNMYQVQYAEPIVMHLPPSAFAFEAALQNFTTGLLQLNMVLRDVQISFGRLHATLEALENNRDELEGALFLDAQVFSTLQRQTLWRNLKLCIGLHNDLLLFTPRVNMLWHQFRLQVPSQERFNGHDVRDTLMDIWQVRAQDIAAYHLNIFGISNATSLLHVLTLHEDTLKDPVLLIQEEWHKSAYLLTQSFQHILDTFYSNDSLVR